MTVHSNTAKVLLGVAASVAALTAATGVQAQAYGGAYDSRGYEYDPCARDTTQRGTTGGLVGAGLGAAIGGSVAAGGAKTEGAVLGGLLGAVAGNQIGKRSAACAPGYSAAPAPVYSQALPPPPPPPAAYYQDQRGYSQGGAYANSTTYYDPCARDRTQRGTTGGLAGAAIGALAGGNIAARNARTEGAVIGALAGAAIGSKVGRNGAACQPGASADYGYQGQGYEQPYAQGGSSYGYETYERYDSRYPDPRDSYGRSGYAAPVADARTDVNGCTLAESPIYLPDGRTQKRFVRVCPDASGRYQVVD
jgi:outer membrane lipoprotein SlyB